MSGLALMEVQRALFNKLHGDGVLMSMVRGVFDAVPQRTALPYVVIGDGECADVAADALALSQLQLRFEVWSDAAGRKTVLAIMNRMYALLHLGTLTLSGYQLVLLRCEQADTELTELATHIRGSMVVRAVVVEA